MTHILTFYNDFQKYPPIISVIKTLLAKGDNVVILGYCSNSETVEDLERMGLEYYEFICDISKTTAITKLFKLLNFRRKVLNYISNNYTTNDTKIWVFNEQCAWLLHSIFYQYKTVLYLFEFPVLCISKRFRILSPRINYTRMMRSAYKIICCEYNRAVITQSFFQLQDTPIVIPNKPTVNINEIPSLSKVDMDLYNLCSNYKVILYQGIFNSPERRLDELCQAIDILPEDFRLVLMGPQDNNTKRLMEKYTSRKIKFVPFLKTPIHLSITRLSYIGFLSYFASKNNIQNTINTLYCAPNKIYEYALCHIPSVSNNSPALKTIFETYKIGSVLESFTTNAIVTKILEIDSEYDKYIDYDFFLNSVDVNSLISSI